jgi:hypothetical protein
MALVEGERRQTSTVGGGIKVSRIDSEGKKGAPHDHRLSTTDYRPGADDSLSRDAE